MQCPQVSLSGGGIKLPEHRIRVAINGRSPKVSANKDLKGGQEKGFTSSENRGQSLEKVDGNPRQRTGVMAQAWQAHSGSGAQGCRLFSLRWGCCCPGEQPNP